MLFGDRGDVLDPLLVGGDRLVLGAVVGGEVAVGECDHGGDDADRLDHALAGRGGGAVAAHQAGERQGRGGSGDEDALVLERHAGGAHAPAHQRQHQHRLGEFDRAAQAGDFGDEAGDQLRFAFGGDFDRAVGAADRGGPVGRAVDEQAVAQGHAAEPQLLRLRFRGRLRVACRHRQTIRDAERRPGGQTERAPSQGTQAPSPPCSFRPEAPSPSLRPVLRLSLAKLGKPHIENPVRARSCASVQARPRRLRSSARRSPKAFSRPLPVGS